MGKFKIKLVYIWTLIHTGPTSKRNHYSFIKRKKNPNFYWCITSFNSLFLSFIKRTEEAKKISCYLPLQIRYLRTKIPWKTFIIKLSGMDSRKLTLQTAPTGIQIPLAAYMKNLKDVGENSFPHSPNLKIRTTKFMTTTSMRPCPCLKQRCKWLF